MEKKDHKNIAENKRLASTVVKHYFGNTSRKLEHMPSGKTNFVFEVSINNQSYIIRISKAVHKIIDFTKEQWIVAKVREQGIPVAEILEVGNGAIPMPYMIQVKLDGVEALYHPDNKRILNQMGKYTAMINSIETVGYGKAFDWSENKLSKNLSWKEYLNNELHLTHRLQVLAKYKMMSQPNLQKLRTLLEKLEKANLPTYLNHGDMRRKNVIVNKKADIVAIIDWEESSSNIVPFYDLAIALHDLSVDNKEYFLEGYGISPVVYAKSATLIKTFNIINYAPVIERLAKRNDQHRLDLYRLRLKGHLDLYSF